MTTWAIGDIHGCWHTLQALLQRLRFDAECDRLWLTGDLVNRGSGSLPVLRWAYRHRQCITSVLGNHDLKLLVCGGVKPGHAFAELLAAPDRDELLQWLRQRPLLHRDGRYLLVHAGIWPDWELDEATALARHGEQQLQTAGGLASVSRRRYTRWRADLEGEDRNAGAIAVLTLVRMIGRDGRPELEYTGAPDAAPAGWQPWYAAPRIVDQGLTVVFGHWAMLGHRKLGNAICLDSGCTWGGSLTALDLDSGRIVQEPLSPADRPG